METVYYVTKLMLSPSTARLAQMVARRAMDTMIEGSSLTVGKTIVKFQIFFFSIEDKSKIES